MFSVFPLPFEWKILNFTFHSQLKFEADGRIEWVYRGSTRLGPLFTELETQKKRRLQNQEAEKSGVHIRRATNLGKRRNAPYIEYTRRDLDMVETVDTVGRLDPDDSVDVKKPVARKSTTQTTRKTDQATTKWEFEGQVFHTEIDPPPQLKFRPHNCSPRSVDCGRVETRIEEFV